MFGFKKKENVQEKKAIYATQSGQVIPLSEVPDPVFSEKMLGDGIAIIPNDQMVLSPVNGTIADVTDTNHAYCIESEDGLDILVHIGIDTVNLKGEGIKPLVKVGDKVKAGQPIANADLELIKSKGFNIHTPIIITNSGDISEVEYHTGTSIKGETIILSYHKR